MSQVWYIKHVRIIHASDVMIGTYPVRICQDFPDKYTLSALPIKHSYSSDLKSTCWNAEFITDHWSRKSEQKVYSMSICLWLRNNLCAVKCRMFAPVHSWWNLFQACIRWTGIYDRFIWTLSKLLLCNVVKINKTLRGFIFRLAQHSFIHLTLIKLKFPFACSFWLRPFPR